MAIWNTPMTMTMISGVLLRLWSPPVSHRGQSIPDLTEHCTLRHSPQAFETFWLETFKWKYCIERQFYFAWLVARLVVLLELGRHFKSKTDTWNIWLLVTQSALLARKNKISINLKVKFFLCLLTCLVLTSSFIITKQKN